MATNVAEVKVDVDTRWAMLWLRLMYPAAYALGAERTLRLAGWGVRRLIRVRLDNGRWRPLL